MENIDYISAKNAAKKWDVQVRIVQSYCKGGRIAGAKKYGNAWMIPASAEKPNDPRRERAAVSKDGRFYTLPRECPQLILTTLYSTPGSGDEVAASLEDAEAGALFSAQLAYFRGEQQAAAKAAGEILQKTSRPDVRMSCGFLLCLASMYSGSAEEWRFARSVISETCCKTPAELTQREFQLASADSGLYDKFGFPDWLLKGCFDPLPGDCYPEARVIYLKLLLLKGDPSAAYICGPLISQCRLEGALISEIYCRLFAAIGFHDRGEFELASEQLDRAIVLALPDRLYSPLAEYRNELELLLDERLAKADAGAVRAVRELNRKLSVGWAELCHEIRGVTYALRLTAREHHAVKLAAKGLSNAEIASRMKLSVNTVKRYVSEAIAKTGACDRKSLSKFIALEGETLP